MRILHALLLVFIGLLSASVAHAELDLLLDSEDGQIYRESSSGDYIIRYQGMEGELQEVRWVPATKTRPVVKSQLVKGPGEKFTYRYHVNNSRDAEQPVRMLILHIPEQSITKLQGPQGWRSTHRMLTVGNEKSEQAERAVTRITWSVTCSSSGCIEPGRGQTGYEYQASALPGLQPVYVRGDTPTLAFPDHGPGGEVSDFLDAHRPTNVDSIARYAMAPVISLDEDMNTILRALADHVETLLDHEVIEEKMAKHLSGELRKAAEAVETGDVSRATQLLGQLRGFLNSANGSKSPEAAVFRDALLFNLNYVQPRMRRKR